MTQEGLFPADDAAPATNEQPLREAAGLFGVGVGVAEDGFARPDMVTRLFTEAEPDPGPVSDNDIASPPLTAVNHTGGKAAGIPHHLRPGRLIGIATAVLAVAALGIATLFFATRPPTDALEPLRNLERTIYSDERNLTRLQSEAATDVDSAATAADQATAAAESLRGLIPDADVDALASAARGVTSAVTDWNALSVPDPYRREITQDADDAAVAAAVAAAEKARDALESALTSAQATQSVLSLRLDALNLAADGATASLVTAADAALAKESPVVDEAFRTAVSAPLEQFRPLMGGGAELLAYASTLSDPLRALTTEQARLEAEEAERQRLLQEQRERQRNRTVPTSPASPVPGDPVPPAPTQPSPAPTNPVEPTPVEPTPTTPPGEPDADSA